MWTDLLADAVKNSSKQRVANALGVSRTAISLIMSNKYPASKQHIAHKVLEVYGRIQCPYLGTEITQAECRTNRTRTAPNNSPREMKFWRACQTCPQNLDNGASHDNK